MRPLIVFAFLLLGSPISAGEFCLISQAGSKLICFPTFESCNFSTSSAAPTCAYFDDETSIKKMTPPQKASPPTFVGPAKWCIFKTGSFLKGLALCSYDTKAECSRKKILSEDECLLNPKFDSDPEEDAAANILSVDRSKWMFFFKSDSMEGHFDVSSVYRYDQFADVRIAVNTSAYRSQNIESTVMDVTIDCKNKARRINRAVGMSARYGEGKFVKDFGNNSRKSGTEDFDSVSEYPLMEALTPRVCAGNN